LFRVHKNTPKALKNQSRDGCSFVACILNAPIRKRLKALQTIYLSLRRALLF
jgi:hypothetical protein